MMTEDKSNLYLGRVVLKNYKAYRGDVEIEMSRDPTKTITIIHGEMGKGKTTLLEAVYWCMYGKDRDEVRSESDETILNNDVLRNLKVGDGAEVYVEIYLYEQDELRYKIKRTVEFTKEGESDKLRSNPTIGGRMSSGIKIEESVEYHEKPRDDDEWEIITNLYRANDKILNIFPRTLASYFLFDAELLDNFFSESGGDNVKQGIEGISGLPLIQKTTRDLYKVSDRILDSIKDVSLEPIKNEVSHLIKSIEQYDKQLSAADDEIVENRRKIQEMKSYLGNYNDAVVSETQKRKNALDRQMSDAKKNLNDHNTSMRNWLVEANIMHRLEGSMKESLDLCNKWEKEGKIPIAVSKRALQNILSSAPPTCICGASLGEGSHGRAHIEDLLKKNLAESPVIQSITTGRGHWSDMVDVLESGSETLDRLRAARSRMTMDMENINSEIKECVAKLREHDVEKIRDVSDRLKAAEERNTVLAGVRAVAEEKKERCKAEKNEKDRLLQIKLRQEEKYSAATSRRNLAKKIIEILGAANASLIHDMRTTVANHTTEYFLRLVSKKDDFSEIRIEPDYATAALGNDGKIKRLSAGQSCCLALSYIAAIRKISEKNYFMLIDSPFHNISQAERVDIAENLPNFIPGTQITLLVQDQEYTGVSKKEIHGESIPSVRDTMIRNKSVWGEYLLRSVKDEGDLSERTTVERVELGR